MIHTLTLSCDLTGNRQLYHQIKDSLYGLERINKSRLLCTKAYYSRGIREITLVPVVKKSVQYHGIDIRVNPGVILEQGESINLINDGDIPMIESRFNSIITDIFGTNKLPDMTEWKVKRIDYAIDIITEHVADYVSLFKRGDRPNNSEIDDRTGSLYIKCKTFTISFYDKYAEQIAKGEQAPLDAINRLRLEIQCEKDKTQYIKKTNGFATKQLRYFLDPQLARNEVLRYWDKTIGVGDYYKLSAAIAIINQSSHTDSMKEKLVQVLRDIKVGGSIYNARRQTSTCDKTFRSHLKNLRTLNINPVIIPDNKTFNYLPSLRSRIEFWPEGSFFFFPEGV